MHIPRTLRLPLAAAAILVTGLTAGACTPERGVEAPTPAASAPFVLPEPFLSAVTCEEHEPCWDCESMGNHICGVTEADKAAAWAAWDAAGGAQSLLVDTHARVSVTGYSLTDPYNQGLPELGIHQLALPESGVWYIFTTTAI